MLNSIAEKRSIPNRMVYILVFVLIYFSNDTTLFGTNMNQLFVGYGFRIDVVLIIATILLFASAHESKIFINLRLFFVLALFVASIALSAIVNHDYRGGYVISILMAFLGFFTTQCIPLEKYSRVYANIFKLFAVCSIIGHIITDIFPTLRSIGFFVQRSTGIIFSNYILYARSIEDQAGTRNYSIFREPGVFQVYLIAAILISVILYDSRKKFKELVGIGVLVVATLMTKSTTAYFGLILVLFFFLVKENYFCNIKKFWTAIVIGTIAAISVIVYFQFFISDAAIVNLRNIFIDKFDSTSIYYESGFARIASVGTNISLWLQNPLFGVGVTRKQASYLSTSMSIYGYQTSIDTNTFLAQFSLYGVVVGLIWIFAVLGLSRCLAKKSIERIIILVIIMMLLMTEYLVFSSICNVFIWYGLSKYFAKKDEKALKKVFLYQYD